MERRMKNEAYSLSISVISLPRTLLISSVHGNGGGSSSFSSVTSLPFFSIQGWTIWARNRGLERKGRRISGGQGNSCGFGMRGQKSRSGPGVRKGFEGGQMPLYRRIPKLRGIAGGMHVGLPKYVPVDLKDVGAAGFQEGDEVSLETLKEKGLINPSGRERTLPLKVLGKEKLEAAGCSLILPGRKRWVKPSVAKNLARAEEYFAKKRAAAAASEPAAA
ncbi:hypothetical protein POTOM_038087 [Populus tomentosa]|uniref:Ribosomal protein L18e/L15P domain-containing protein n=1 Tax=Populus tomentosa TaxID=118781 RepID=A0A8X8CL13_POPTO|nr:hypothetical protein POTOM_038087 [Populus tomentosa]